MQRGGKYLVLGGGISGLSAAYRLLQKVSNPSNITLIESTSRLGGWIHSKRYEDGSISELGPRSIRPAGSSGVSALELVYDLGLEKDVVGVSSDHVSAKNRYIFAHDKIHKLPSGILELLKPQTLLSKNLLGVLLKEMFVPQVKDDVDESIYSFICRRFDSEVADFIVDAVCRGIFAGDIKKLSVKSCLAQLYGLEKTSGSVVRGSLFGKRPEKMSYSNALVEKAFTEQWSLWTLRNGLQSMVEALEAKLLENGVNIIKNNRLSSLNFLEGGSVEIHTERDGAIGTADHVLSSIPSAALAAILPDEHATLGHLLQRTVAVTAAVVPVQYEGSIAYPQGFGILYPSCESAQTLGVIFDSSIFPHADSKASPSTRFTVMLGGHLFEDQFGKPDVADRDYIRSVALATLRDDLGIHAEPRQSDVFVHKECIPQYHVGHSELIGSLRNYVMQHGLPLSFIGSWYDGVGVSDCIHYSQCAVDSIINKVT